MTRDGLRNVEYLEMVSRGVTGSGDVLVSFNLKGELHFFYMYCIRSKHFQVATTFDFGLQTKIAPDPLISPLNILRYFFC